MGIIDIVLLLLTVLLIGEAVLEARRKNWLALAISLLFIVLVVYMSRGIYFYLWQQVVPSP